MASLAALLIFLTLALLGIPLVWALVVGSMVGALLLPGVPLEIVAEQVFAGFDSFVLVAIPLFMLAGELLNKGGVIREVVRAFLARIPRSRETLPLANIFTSVLFSGVNGSALADTSAIGGVLIPAMSRAGHERSFASALTAASSVVGPIVPPSIVFIYYGSITGTSVADLFIGGVVPGLAVAVLLSIYVVWHTRLYYDAEAIGNGIQESSSANGVALWRLFVYALGLPIVVLGIGFGIVSPVEAAAVAVVYAIVCVIISAGLNFVSVVKTATSRVAHLSGDILLLVAFSKLMAWVLIVDGVAGELSRYLAQTVNEGLYLLLIANILLIILGTLVDTFPAIAIAMPVIEPAANALGVDPIHLGVLVVVNLMVGAITPPVGGCIFLASKIGEVPFEATIREVVPMIIMLLVAVLLVTIFPTIATALPTLLSGG